MAERHAYTTSQGGLVQTISQFRSAFPAKVDASTLKKLGFAPNNESYIINVLRFLALIDDDGTKTDLARQVFSLHNDSEFSAAFESIIEDGYKDLFELRGEGAWELDADSLIGFFRGSDGTSATVGKRQANTFQLLAGFAGHGEMPSAKTTGAKSVKRSKATAKPKLKVESDTPDSRSANTVIENPVDTGRSFGLSVRVEVNLPADGNQTTYDRIFKSIRENLLNV